MIQQEVREKLLDLLYPKEEGVRYWGGWNDLFEPSIPSRLFGEGFRLIREAFESGNTDEIVRFLHGPHVKLLSQAGRGESDVICEPTEKAMIVIELFLKYGDK